MSCGDGSTHEFSGVFNIVDRGRKMRLIGHLRVIKVVALIFTFNCAINGDGGELCNSCNRAMPARKDELSQEDLLHLNHNDPCHEIEDRAPTADRRAKIGRCESLVDLYLKSDIYFGGKSFAGKQSKCLNAKYDGCLKHGFDAYSKYHCTVEVPGSGWLAAFAPKDKTLASCVREDFGWYRSRTREYGATYTVADTPKARPQIVRPQKGAEGASSQSRGSRRRRSQSPSGRSTSSRDDRGRSTSRSASGISAILGFRSRKAKSNSPTRHLLCDWAQYTAPED